ncbi:DUF6316 family protein [Teredinibacter purpureus]|uniref:DUF6316 family protein n=1 Tax=Teredinibacter purpureus TaxID=2731756 RepID=UPI0005F8269A|nr:DUF6316 family protein [Teredinibacter purpureus]
MAVRNGEIDEKVWYRNERFFCVDGSWFFSTREGTEIGPYTTRLGASNGLQLYVHYMQASPPQGQEYASKIAKQGLWATTLWH